MAICDSCNGEMLEADGCTDKYVVYDDDRGIERIRFGDEMRFGGETFNGRCPDCNVKVGEFHHPGCDIEECPRCGRQLLSCDCPVIGTCHYEEE